MSTDSQNVNVHSCHLLFDHFQFALIYGPNILGSYAISLFTASNPASITSPIHNWVLFLLWLHTFILSGVISLLIQQHIGHLLTWGVHLSVSYLFAFSYCSWGSKGKNTEVVCHSLLQWTTFCQQIWKTQQWPQDWKRSVFIPIPKKGNAKECSNYHTNALISHASKVMLKILQARLQQYSNHELPDVQSDFRKGRGTRDQIANIHWMM